MGKKINPKIFRMGITRDWQSKWFSTGADYIAKFEQDVNIRKFMIKTYREAGIDRVEIERNAKKIIVNVYTAKPGLLIGRGGSGVDDLRKLLHKKFLSNPAGIRVSDLTLNVLEVDRPSLSSQIIVQSIALEIEKRIPFRKVMKQAIGRVERAGGLGVKIIIAGRLNGAEIARSEMLAHGKVPLHTLRADIDYARGAAHTTYGAIGIKVWIYKGDKFEKEIVESGDVIGKRQANTK